MIAQNPHLEIRLAADDPDRISAQKLRYRVFVQELGGDGDQVDHQRGLERDRYDEFAAHLILVDNSRSPKNLDHVVGVYRLMDSAGAAKAGQFYSAAEYDLSLLIGSGRRLLELGRSCVDPDYRGGMALLMLWQGVAGYVAQYHIDILFGVASFHGTDQRALALPLSYLHHHHLAPPDLRIEALAPTAPGFDLIPAQKIDQPTAMRAIPALIKAYLRIGGGVGAGVYVDHRFNTTDVCMVLDTARMNNRLLVRTSP